jgi:hypothetical protein
MEGRAQVKGDTRHLEEITPHMPGEHRIMITDDRCREPREANNAIKEGSRD